MTTIITDDGIKIVYEKVGEAIVVLVGPDSKDLRIPKVVKYSKIGRRLKIVLK